MPRDVHWHRISHDFNHDPQIIEMRERFGADSALMWIECLSIADRYEGVIKCDDDTLCRMLARLDDDAYHFKRAIHKAEILLTLWRDWGWISGTSGAISVVNYWKYRKKRGEHQPDRQDKTLSDSKKNPQDDSSGSKKNLQSLVDRAELTVSDLAESWNEWFAGKLPQVQTPISSSRTQKAKLRIREHPTLEFWQGVFSKIKSSKFLLGNNKNGWNVTFDWLITNDTNAVKIAEGTYDDGKNFRG